ncbi:MAG: ribosomal RNA small subunit methyltransferase A [Clostridia bacterium]|nr:ribosomal RNA small subunit methyltransferase A [Clostridia bacterium]
MKKRKHYQAGFAYKHSLGQNFILDDALMREVADAAGIGPDDCVIEIGPGMGTLTRMLAERAAQVVAIEVDESLRPFLTVALEHSPNASVIYRDVLSLNLREISREMFGADRTVRVAANIPYYITTEILEKTIRELPEARSLAFMVQKEVADKLMAGPGEDGYGPLGILCQKNYELERALEVPAACFTPQPKVDSTFLVMNRIGKTEDTDDLFFDRMVHRIFLMRRKTLLNNLISQYSLSREAAETVLDAAGIPRNARAEELAIETLKVLCSTLQKQLAVSGV